MNTIYCPDCGYKNNYEGARVKFCSSCGQPFDKSSASLVRPAARPTTTQRIVDDTPDELPEEIKFDAGSIKFEKPKMMTVGSVREEGGGGFERNEAQEMTEIREKALAPLLKDMAAHAPAPAPAAPRRGRPRKS